MGEPKEAIDYYNKALEMDQNLSDVHYNLGNALYLIEETDRAIAHYETAIKLNPKKAESYYNLGNALCIKAEFE
jgi:tetratricopeptide (TPR) repeat protein